MSAGEETETSVARLLAEDIEVAELLLSYAAEEGKQLEDSIVEAVVHTKHAVMTRELNAVEEAAVWNAYGKLCKAIQPVSRSSLESIKRYPQKRWFRGMKMVSRASRTVFRYQLATSIFLVVLLAVQVYWVSLSTLVEEQNELDSQLSEVYRATAIAESKWATVSAQLWEPFLGDEESDASRRDFIEKSRTLESEVYNLQTESLLMGTQWDANMRLLSILLLRHRSDDRRTEKEDQASSGDSPRDELARLQVLRDEEIWHLEQESAEHQWQQEMQKKRRQRLRLQSAKILADILLVYVLPILYGLVGAGAYVLRTLSVQIKDRTFTNSSRIGLQLRVFLGALAGFSIAWFVTPPQDGGTGVFGSITPLALAFLAGYSVELLFYTMDTLISAFSRERDSESAAAG